MITFVYCGIKEYAIMYLPSPLCSNEENETIASNMGAFPVITNVENSVGAIVVILGWVVR